MNITSTKFWLSVFSCMFFMVAFFVSVRMSAEITAGAIVSIIGAYITGNVWEKKNENNKVVN